MAAPPKTRDEREKDAKDAALLAFAPTGLAAPEQPSKVVAELIAKLTARIEELEAR